ncbi:MAG: monofunctional biosynthetic peptidoglycan transglycosylase [Deltaproteobacteria bacterium]|nr:monofunctional biosynthetic peptidoglycan transglycosylase [Deltaproteobacteria bacterium]
MMRRWMRRAFRVRPRFWLVGIALVFHVLVVGGVRFVNPPVTLTMLGAMWDHRGWPEREWRTLDELGDVPRIAVAAEDGAFWMHAGFDWVGICAAIDRNRSARAEGSTHRVGGSTIPQQVVRNVFLWQGRSWFRKGLETWLTIWLVRLVPRERILELYVNLAQTGPLTFGVEAGAQEVFGRPASALSEQQSALLLALLPAPATRSITDTSVVKQAGRIRRNRSPWPGEPGFDDMAQRWSDKNPGALGCAWQQLMR